MTRYKSEGASTTTSIQQKCEVSGNVERITYHNKENGFCVLKVKVLNYQDLVTITANAPSISVGEGVVCTGTWFNHSTYGKQFKAQTIYIRAPNTLEGVTKYLSSGLVKGIGEHFAKKLVTAFGEEVFDVIENTPEKLYSIEGIGSNRVESICKNWNDQKIVRDIMIFLQSHSIGTARATKIFKFYGDNAISIISENPYRLSTDIKGIGFLSADKIAHKIGVPKNSLIRARAGLSHVLVEGLSSGHCGLPLKDLLTKAQELLGIEIELIQEALKHELEANNIIHDTITNQSFIFLQRYYLYEQHISNILLRIANTSLQWKIDNPIESIESIENNLNIQSAHHQKEAIATALTNKVVVITGGPGTGKTTLIKILSKILNLQELSVKLCAPTGRAAQRLSEATQTSATTIHRLLGINKSEGGFLYNTDNRLSCDYLIVDEGSMIDVALFFSLISALPDTSALLIVGDVDQLPSVKAGQVLKDLIDSNVITTVRLTEIFRQAGTSDIITNAHKVNRGVIPNLSSYDKNSDFRFISAEPGEDVTKKIIHIMVNILPKKFSLDPINDVQILCPMQRGSNGAKILNTALQQKLNPKYQEGISNFDTIFAIGDKVMQTENNYNKEVFNGDIGKIIEINKIEEQVIINFYGYNIIYDFEDLDQITLAYAVTIHKSQGSEYPAVIIPITMQNYIMLKRNLIYTAITRGKYMVIVIGSKKAIAMAVKDINSTNRHSKLKEWLNSTS